MHDAIVVGGGPGGLYAASKIAAAGFSVALFEEHEGSGEPVHCTGVLAAAAFDEFGLDGDPVVNQLRKVRFYAPSGDTVEYSTPGVEAVVIDRVEFDRRLASGAARAGVQLSYGDRVTAIDVDASAVAVTAGGTVRRARTCILACGAAYAAQRKLRLGIPRLLLHSAQAELPASRPGDVEVHFGARIAPRGFAWAVPVLRDRPSVRIGVMCEGHADRYFDQMLGRLAARWGIRSAAAAACRPRQKILPLGPIRRTFADRVLVVGDAAGLVKPTTGGGIYYSLLSARIAADTRPARPDGARRPAAGENRSRVAPRPAARRQRTQYLHRVRHRLAAVRGRAKGLAVRGESAVAGKWGQTPFSPRLKPHVKMGSAPISHRRHGPLQPVQDFHHGLLTADDAEGESMRYRSHTEAVVKRSESAAAILDHKRGRILPPRPPRPPR